MSNYKRKEVMDYLTRKPVTQQDFQAALDVSSLKAVMPSAPGIPNPQDRILELADGGRIELAGGSVAKSTKNKLIDDFLKEELKNNKGKITNQSSADLAKKFNDKYPNKNFYFNGELSPVDHKSIHYRISNNPDFKKNITLIIGRRTDPVYEDKINKAIEVYKKLPEEQKRALRTGGVGHTGALDKFMEENDLFRESSKYGSKMNQKAMDKTLFGRKLNEAGVERPEAIPQEENIKNQKLRRKEIIGNIGSTGYEKHIEDFKRNLQDYLGIEKTKLSTGKKMFPLDLAHRTDIDQLHALNQKMDPSDLGVDYYKTNREGYKSIEGKLSDLYDEQNKLYKQAKKLDKVPESLSKKIFLNNDEILQTIGESPFKDRLKPITINPVTLEVKRGSVITDDITKQLGIGLVDKPMNKIKIGSKDDAIIKLNLAQQVVDEANRIGLIKNVDSARKAANEFVVGKPLSNKSLSLYADPTGIGTFLETGFGQALSKTAPNLLKATAKLSTVTGTPLNAVLGVAFNADEFKEMGLSDLETIAAGAYKGSTQDLLNFGDLIFRKLPVAVYEKFVQDKPFLESLLNKPDYFEFADKQINKYTSAKSIKDRIQNRAEFEVRKSIPINTSETEVPTITTEEYNNLVENKKNEILNANPNLKQLYEGEVIQQPKPVTPQQSILGPIVFPKYTQEELNFAKGGRVKFAEGSDDPESDLYIPPLNKESISGTNVPKEGIDGLYFGTRQEQRPIPVDPMTGKPILSGGMRELKQVFSSLLSDTRPEAGYRKGNIDFYASKGINPFQGDTDFKYGASYTPEGNVGKFMIDKTPQYLGAGYNYQKDGLDFGITGLKNQMGDKSIALRFGYNYATGGRVGFSGGGGANFLKMLRNISDSLLGIKNSTHILGNTARFNGITKAAEEALTPYINIPNQNKHTTVLESIKKAKENLPKEYHGILDEMKSYADKHAYDAVDDMAKALDKIVDPNLKFESLPQNMFPMEDPLNSAFIIMDPQRNNMRGRFVNRVRVDPETGRGTRETFDTFDSKTRTFLKEEDWKPVGVESLEKGKEGLN